MSLIPKQDDIVGNIRRCTSVGKHASRLGRCAGLVAESLPPHRLRRGRDRFLKASVNSLLSPNLQLPNQHNNLGDGQLAQWSTGLGHKTKQMVLNAYWARPGNLPAEQEEEERIWMEGERRLEERQGGRLAGTDRGGDERV